MRGAIFRLYVDALGSRSGLHSYAMRASIVVASLLIACDPGVQLGLGCSYSSECADPLVCAFGRCRAECFEHRDCSLDALCLLDGAGLGACALADDPDCRDPGEMCADALACFAGECLNACESLAECPRDSRCEPTADGRARCVAIDRDAGTPDAGAGSADAGASQCSGDRCIVSLSASSSRTCAVDASGAVWCWGRGNMLGTGATLGSCVGGSECAVTPVRARYEAASGAESDLAGAREVVVGEPAICAVIADGHLRCFDYRSGTDPLGGFAPIARDVRLSDSSPVIDARSVTLGWGVGFVRRTSPDSLLVWGSNITAQHGTGASDDLANELAIEVRPLAPVDAIDAANGHVCAIRLGDVWCWGLNDHGQAGHSTTGTGAVVTSPHQVPGISRATAISSGRNGTCALAGGELYCWGARTMLGVFARPAECGGDCSSTPVRVRPESAPFTYVSASLGSEQVYAVAADGSVWCWGLNDPRVCSPEGDGVIDERARVVDAPASIEEIAVGDAHVCALAEGIVWCWGANQYGQLGRGTFDEELHTPAPVSFPEP